MGFPSENLEGVYRNHIEEVVRLVAFVLNTLCLRASTDKANCYWRTFSINNLIEGLGA